MNALKATEVVSIVAVLAITVSFTPSKEEDWQSALVFASYGVYYCFSFRDDIAVNLQIRNLYSLKPTDNAKTFIY